ncbi:DUF2155 domain-containing protein [Thalassococcus sp. CAU 1522]|uniref:DUF2155 domain-containing protein n=1 Tax=Thalassococcus arenae TaxID=2851652 RepID=A0ABS6N8L2_9RHOB|nr:DUF2155 domain-containing protein [Thalassococcus arenae]MBV2360355.1 DUF2155 domain-containing protein [Thalassococcus arenae]
MRLVSLALVLLAATASAQEAVNTGTGAILRGLDKLNAKVADVTIPNGGTASIGRVEVMLKECRYPEGNPSGDAYAYLTVREIGVAEPVFSGWMVASSPALNPMNHPRYDVWVMRCTTE